MNKLLTTIFALAVASVTAHAQTPTTAAPAAVSAAPAAPKAAPAPAGAKSIDAKVAMCIGCHGIKGYQASFPEVHKVPMISGQSAAYIAAALNQYKTGDRKHPTMRGIADALSEQDMKDIAAYYESHGKDAKAAPAGAAQPNERIQALINRDKDNSCTSCHGANFNTPKDGSVAKIAGQHADYLYVSLKAYKAENNPAVGRANGVMQNVARKYTNAELKELANYISSLPGELKTVPESKFR